MNIWQYSTKDNQQIDVRHAHVDDAKDLYENFCMVVEEAEWLPTLRPNSNQAEWVEWIKRTFSNREVLLIASVEGRYAGHLSLQPEEWNAARHVARLGIVVRKEMRNLGIGRALMLAAEDAGRTQRYEKIVLSTFETNAVARSLYSSLGYHLVGRRLKHFLMPNGYINEILMEKLIV